MSVHSWTSRSTKYFGDAYYPVAEIQMQTARGRFRSVQILIDSGAVISLLRRSSADLLGLDLTTGRPVNFAFARGGVRAYLHDLSVRFPGEPPFTAPFAIADTEEVPMLLGRLGIFDQFEITFDPRRRETRILRPNLPPNGAR